MWILAALPGALAPGKARRPQPGIPHDSESLSCLTVLMICNSAAGEIGSEKRSPFLKLQNLLFNLIAPRVQISYKFQWFFNDSEMHPKKSLRTRLALWFDFMFFSLCSKCFINACKHHFLGSNNLTKSCFSSCKKTQKHL